MDFFSKGYTALRGPAGQPQTALDTIVKLSDRLTQSTLISDRRAAVLGLKGLTRDCKADVGQHAFDALLALLETDAKDDVDSGRAILETLALLCQVDSKEGGKIPRDDLGLRHTDVALSVSFLLHLSNPFLTCRLHAESRAHPCPPCFATRQQLLLAAAYSAAINHLAHQPSASSPTTFPASP